MICVICAITMPFRDIDYINNNSIHISHMQNKEHHKDRLK